MKFNLEHRIGRNQKKTQDIKINVDRKNSDYYHQNLRCETRA